MSRTHSIARAVVLMGFPLFLATSAGCTLLSQVVMTLQDRRVPAKFEGLEGKKVAVVCLDAHTLRVPGGEAEALARALGRELVANVKDMQLVSESKIADWMDNQNDDVVDFRDVAKGVKADMVVGIDLKSFSIHEPGGTLLKGRTTVEAKVYDMARPHEAAYVIQETQIAFPEHGLRHVTENEANFRILFIQQIGHRLAKDFYAYDKMEDFNSDAKFIGD